MSKSKFIISIIMLVIIYFSKIEAQDTAFYFGYSTAIKNCGKNEIKEQTILYTDICTCICNIDSLSIKSKQWQEYAFKNCLNKRGCTADLYYFNNYKVAESRLKELLYFDKMKPNKKLVSFE